MTLTVGSLFSGLGAFDLAFERAGFRVAWQCEIDKHARSVLARHWPDVPCYGDIAAIDPADLEPVDVVTFGSPCQDLSVAGKRAGLEGERSGLFYQAARVIRGLRPAPAMVVWENVAGTLSSADGWDFAAVLDTLAECGAVDLCWRLLDGQYAGVAQRRRRVWLVGDFGGERAGQVLLESESLRGHPATRREAGEGAPAGAGNGVAFGLSNYGAPDVMADISPALPAKERGGGRVEAVAVAGADRARQGKGPNTTLDDGALVITPGVTEFLPQSSRVYLDDGLAPTLQATGKRDGNRAPQIAQSVALRGRDGGATAEQGGDRATALRASQGGGDKAHVLAFASTGGGKPGQGYPASFDGMTVRRLTPRECERLQALPDDWTRWGADGKELADGPRYRLIGNSLIVNEAHWIAGRIHRALSTENAPSAKLEGMR